MKYSSAIIPGSKEPIARSAEELLHELQVRQIELEMQYDELRRTQAALEESNNRYIEYYDHAPVGYLILNHEGLISEANLTVAKLLGTDRNTLLSRHFSTLVTRNDSDQWYLFFNNIKKHNQPLSVGLSLNTYNDTKLPVQLDCLYVNSTLRITLTDITNHKQSKDSLRLTNIALKEISQGVLITSSDQNILWANDAFLSITGYDLPELLNRNCRIIQGPLSDPQTIRDISLALKNHTQFSGEILNYRKDATPFWNELTITPVFDGHGQLSNFISTNRDITRRKQLEIARRQAYYQLKSFIQQAPLSIAMFDLNMNYLAISDTWLAEFGRNNKNLIGCNHYEVCPDLPAEWRVIHQQCLAGASLKNDEDLWVLEDGSHYWLRWAVSPWFDEKGSIGGIIITSENITERKQLEEDLRVIKKRLEFAVEYSQIGVWDLDLINNTSWRSLGHDRIFGYEESPSAWSTAIAMRHVFPEDREQFSQGIKKAFRTGNLFLECRIIQPNQSLRWINVRGRVIFDEKARPIRMLGTVLDITERKHREHQDKAHLDQLAHVTRLGLMGEMASGIAHEVNQPLTAIATYTQVSLNLINNDNPDLAKLAEVAVKTQDQALRAGQIIHRMKQFCKAKSEHRSATVINELINDCVNLCNDPLKQNSIKLTLKLESNLPLIHIDHIQIEQVLINLIRNSIDAILSSPTNKQGHIGIQSHLTANNEIQVSVKDNGSGIQEEQQPKIITPFHTTKADGMGMGLSISLSLIEAHKGTMHFKSQFGKGSTFYFTLPIEEPKSCLLPTTDGYE